MKAISYLCLCSALLAMAASGSGAETPRPWAALVIDRSVSMKGFAQAGLPDLVDDIDHAIARVPSFRPPRKGAVQFFGVGEKITALAEPSYLESGSGYGEIRADLAAALTVQSPTAGAALLILLTDGQPSPTGSLNEQCRESTRPNLSALARPIADLLAEGGRRAWLWLDRIPFAGEIYLNCSRLGPDRRRRENFNITCEGRKECHASHKGERTVFALVVSAPEREAEGTRFVEALLERRPQSRAVGLWRDDRESRRVEVLAEGWRTSTAMDGQGSDRVLRVTCHELSADEARKPRAFSVTLSSLTKPSEAQALALWSRSPLAIELRDQGTERSAERVFKLPDGMGVNEMFLDSAPRLEGNCERAFRRYESYWNTIRRSESNGKAGEKTGDKTAPSSSCGVGGDDSDAPCWEFIGLCDCGLPRPTSTATIEISAGTERQIDKVLEDLGSRQMVAEEGRWLDQLDRIAGLGDLLEEIADIEDARLGEPSRREPLTTVRVEIEPLP